MKKAVFAVLSSLLKICLSVFALTTPAVATAQESRPASALRIAFFSPGYQQSDNPTGQFWPESSRFAAAVATKLGIELDIHYADRNYLKMQQQVSELLRGNNRPDYLLLVNEQFALTPQIREINQSGVPFFLAYNHLQKPGSKSLLTPRTDYKNWIGSLIPDNRYAGYALAKHLIKQIQSKPPRILVLAANNITSSAVLREHGLALALQQHPSAQIRERIVGNWGFAEPRRKIAGILHRHPDINMIWSANGPMALGALEGLLASETHHSALTIGSINWDPEELAAIESGQLSVSFGGHFMTAGLSLILINDYHHGIDFKTDGGIYQQRRLFYPASAQVIKRHPVIKSRQWDQIEFRRMSKHRNPKLDKYDFRLESLLNTSDYTEADTTKK